MKLKSIKIKGFKSFKELELDLFNLNVLIGPNGAGKSNFLSFFKLINAIIDKRMQVFIGASGGADSLLHYGRKITENIEFELRFDDLVYVTKLISSKKDSLVFQYESIYNSSSIPQYIASSGYDETDIYEGAKGRFPDMISAVITYLKNYRVYHFHDTSDTSKMKLTCDIDDNEMLRYDASNIAAYLYFLKEKHPQHYKNIVDTVRGVIPLFDDFNLRPSKLNNSKIKLEWLERDSDTYFDVNYLSDGSLRFICLATLLLQPELPEIILIDEPELGLHPSAIALLAGMLRSASKKTQVICSTQSVTLVNKFDPRNIIVVNRKGKESTCKCLSPQDLEEWLEDYELGDLWEKNVLNDIL